MTTVNELREKRATAWNATKAFLESRRTDKGTQSLDLRQYHSKKQRVFGHAIT